MKSFGYQVITFVSYEDSDTRSPLGTYTQTEAAVDVPGCHHRPMPFSETKEFDMDVSTQVWKSTVPPVDAVLAAEADGEIRVAGVTYHIIGGPRVHVDRFGKPFKATIISQLKIG